ncbi:MAF protein [Ectopseudomonas oleovorans]|uniref:7-methyl-GTP pyrophosphatase n=1 Tax=Ectopseudomonas oleovorans TaxID=301 RepID=A0A397N6T8_ECTOL|nr:MAF protein [Pseudomonas oleovorans]
MPPLYIKKEETVPALLLASSSPYRRELLDRLQLPFTWQSPSIDETRREDEIAIDLVRRLAEEKARALAGQYTDHLIIGSDQVAVLGDGQILGKPHDLERAQKQLRAASGSSVTFLTGLALLNSQSGRCQVDCVPFTVHFRSLSDTQILRYLQREQPFDCAGSFKSEGLGISLFRSTEGEDASSLIGLPLIRLVDMLINEGIEVP